MSIYDKCKAANVMMDNHESDLYIPVNSTTKTIINEYEHNPNVTVFMNQIDGKPWYSVPFAYSPYWVRKQQIACTHDEEGIICRKCGKELVF